ncbi:MAG: non-canonical purine NTP pyrophosphatase [Candidatus Micrarchaeota archaeon]|nr:non-canonical purine NTP pyrophosphatase [Candidatus Micrarchaeota archaeon]
MEFVFVTSNKNKLREAEQILGRKIVNSPMDIPEIQSIQVRDIVVDKAMRAYSKLKKPVLVEDGGLYIKSLGGFPGALVKWLSVIGYPAICAMVQDNKREAYAEVYLCLYDGKKPITFQGRTYGTISKKPSGTSSFGWDVIFIPRGQKQTYAEMNVKLKNKISQRGKAFRKLKKLLS